MFSRQEYKRVCVGVYVCMKGVHTGSWCGQDAKRVICLHPEGPNTGVQTGGTRQVLRAGAQRAPKHADQNTKCKSGGCYGVGARLCLQKRPRLGSERTCCRGPRWKWREYFKINI